MYAARVSVRRPTHLLCLLALALVTGRAQAPVPATPAGDRESPGISRPFLEGVWLEHLWLQVDRVRDQPRAVERYGRRILQFKDNDRLALKSVIRSVLTRQEYQYAGLLCRYGKLLDREDPEWDFHLRRIELNSQDRKFLTPVPPLRLTVMREQVQQAAADGDTAALKDLEGQYRDQLSRHTQDEGLLTAMAEAYVALEEKTLAAAVYREAHALAPGHLEALRAYALAVERVGEGGRLAEAVTASTPALIGNAEFNAFAGQVLHRNGLSWLSLSYLARWCTAEPENGVAWEALGTALDAIGEESQARAAYVRAIRLTDKPAGMLRKLALIAAKDRNPAEAAVWLEQLKPLVTEDELLNLLAEPEFENIPSVLHIIQ